MTKRLRAVALGMGLSGLLVLGAAGCGDDDDSSAPASDQTGSNDVDELDELEDMIDEDEVADALEGSGIDRDCVVLALRVQEAFGSTAAGVSDPTRFGDAADAFAALADDLPEVSDELDTISDALRAAEDGDLSQFSSEDFSAAQDAVSDHFSEVCPG